MNTDSYTLAVPLDALESQLTRALRECAGRSGEQHDRCIRNRTLESLCPCIRGEACVCEAVARELERRLPAGISGHGTGGPAAGTAFANGPATRGKHECAAGSRSAEA